MTLPKRERTEKGALASPEHALVSASCVTTGPGLAQPKQDPEYKLCDASRGSWSQEKVTRPSRKTAMLVDRLAPGPFLPRGPARGPGCSPWIRDVLLGSGMLSWGPGCSPRLQAAPLNT